MTSRRVRRLPANNDNDHAHVSPTDSHFVSAGAARIGGFPRQMEKTGKIVLYSSFLGVYSNSTRYQRDNGTLAPNQNFILVVFREPLYILCHRRNFQYTVFCCNKVKTQLAVFSISPKCNGFLNFGTRRYITDSYRTIDFNLLLLNWQAQ